MVIESVPWPPCPLTVAETWLEARASIEPARRPFLARVLDTIVYSNLPVSVVVGGAVLVCVAILVVYVRRYLRRGASGGWRLPAVQLHFPAHHNRQVPAIMQELHHSLNVGSS